MDVNQFAMETLAVSAISLTLTRAKITDRLRGENIPQTIRNLYRCPYCMCHWTASPLGFKHGVFNPLYWFALVGAAAIVMGVIQRLWLWQEARIHTLENDLDEATEQLRGALGISPNILHD